MKNKKSLIAIIAVTVVVVVAIVVALCVSNANAYKDVVADFATSIEEGSDEEFFERYPQYYLDSIEVNGVTNQNLLDQNNSQKKIQKEQYEEQLGGNIKVSYDITQTTRATDKALEEINTALANAYGTEVNVKDAYLLSYTYQIKGKEKSIDKQDEIIVIKIGAKWYQAFGIDSTYFVNS